jgi:hypothetical protein
MNTVSEKITKKKPRGKPFDGQPGPGRPKGVPNKSTAAIKDMLLASLDQVGGQAYFKQQAIENPNAYMSLIGKIIPAEVKNQITGADGGPVQHSIKVSFGDDS